MDHDVELKKMPRKLSKKLSLSSNLPLTSILVLFLLAALMMLRQITSEDYFSCIREDSYIYTSWAWQFIEALKEGVVYPRWLPLNFWGYGSPTFIFYPPLAFYLAAFINMFAGSVITAMNITKFAALFLAGTGMFFLVKEFYSEKVALLTAGFYLIIPYNIFQFYFIGTFAFVVSFMWFAPVILFTYRYMKNRLYKDAVLAGICYGGLILTHIVNAYMFTFVLVAFIIYMSVTRKRLRELLIIPFIVTIGLLISAAYLLPMIFEKGLINLSYLVGEGGGYGFDFHNYFVLPNMTNKFSDVHLWRAYYKTFIFHVLFFGVILVLFLAQFVKFRDKNTINDLNSITIFFIGVSISSIFLLFGISNFIWETIPFFEYIQFPPRWLGITTFTIVFLSSLMFLSFVAFYKTSKRYNLFIILLLLLCLALDYKYISTAIVFPAKDLIPSTGANWTLEYLPDGVKVEEIFKYDDEKRIIITKGEGKAEIVKWESARRIIQVTSQTPLTVWIRTFYFPGWKAYLDSVKKEIDIEEGTGAMLVKIPQGKHRLALQFEDTPVRYYAKIISITTFIFMGFLFIVNCCKSKRH